MYVYKDLKPVFSNGRVTKYENVTDNDAIQQSLMNIFLINKNEVPGKPWFGNPLRVTVFDNFDTFTETDLKYAIRSEVEKFEPRVDIEDIKVIVSPENNRIVVGIVYYYLYNEQILQDTLYIPFAYNTRTFIDGRSVATLSQ